MGFSKNGSCPDHPKIKSVSKVFEKIATSEGFRLFANVELGKDVSLAELQSNYDAVVISTGVDNGKKLGIPGEQLPGSISAGEFVPWYNGHPDFADLNISLDTETAVVIGAGNVAMDVARMLALNPKELELTDTALHAIEIFNNSEIRKVHLCARRGPEHAAFTSPEIRELPKLEHTSVYINENEINKAISRVGTDSDSNSNLEAMLAIAHDQKPKQDRSLELHFLLTPKEIRGQDRVEEIIFTINEVHGDTVVATDETLNIKCGLVVTAIGYETKNFLDLEIEHGHLKNVDGKISENLYVVGWAKRGPSGVIGTNKSDSTEVMKLLVENLAAPKSVGDFKQILEAKNIQYVTQADWEKINETEVNAGQLKGKPRIKLTDRQQLLNILTN